MGPEKLLDVLVIAPCTGATLARLASGLTDTACLLYTSSFHYAVHMIALL